jgi:hypothetical protein
VPASLEDDLPMGSKSGYRNCLKGSKQPKPILPKVPHNEF